jgi:hypothetical protein
MENTRGRRQNVECRMAIPEGMQNRGTGAAPGAVGDGVARVANDVVALEKAPVAY